MTDKDILNLYLPLVDFLADALGPSTEVVLNDCSKLASSVIAIRNNHHSGRKLGSPITDYAMSVIRSGEYKNKNYDIHYKGKANEKDFISSSFYIKNPSGKLVGMLCLNTDTGCAEHLLDATRKLLESMNFGMLLTPPESQLPATENLDTSLTTLINPLITKTIEKYGHDPSRMTREEKMEIVRELSQQGVSSVKGGVAEIALQLKISESTVYRYLNKKEL